MFASQRLYRNILYYNGEWPRGIRIFIFLSFILFFLLPSLCPAVIIIFYFVSLLSSLSFFFLFFLCSKNVHSFKQKECLDIPCITQGRRGEPLRLDETNQPGMADVFFTFFFAPLFPHVTLDIFLPIFPFSLFLFLSVN